MFPFGLIWGCCGGSSNDQEVTRDVVREVVMVPCKYCGTLFQQTVSFCPHCGARRTA